MPLLRCDRNGGMTTRLSQGNPMCAQREEVPGRPAFAESEISTCPSHWAAAKLALSPRFIPGSRVEATGVSQPLCFQLFKGLKKLQTS